MLLGSNLIIYKQAKDFNNKNRDLKVKIYDLILKTILKYIKVIYYIQYLYKIY